MNNSFPIPNRRFLLAGIALLIAILFTIESRAQCDAPTLKFHSPVLLTGTDGQQGAVYLFQNVIPGVDAHIEIMGLYGGATLYNIDDSTGIGYYDAFQPYVGAAANDTSYIDWKISFKVSGTENDTMLACLAVTGVDVDGDGAYLQEFIEAATPGSIAVDPFTILHVSFDGVRSKAVSTISNIPLIDTNHLEAMFQMNFMNISTLLYRNGAISTYGAEEIRQTCIYFKPFFQTYTLLPVKILSFTAKPAGEFTRIEWSASNEDDIRNYTVEKSLDGRTWKDLQTLHPGSSTTINNYTITDVEQNSGNSYYRLKQTNTRGLVRYSKIIRLNSPNSAQKSITHNTLVKNTINFQIYGTTSDEYSVEYYTTAGSKIKQDKFQIHPGINYANVQIGSEMSPGFYFFVMKNNKGQKVYSSRLMKN
ncbi:MAG: hypothetical protein H7122_13350 [Chitinophagaceae bacterium]|nr:hypothetical protein [Chitinophagaceae bacterium]